MFRSKKDVDRHVQDIFRKLKNEEEKNLRCYNIAKLYYQVGDYESAKRYVSSYLEVREGSAGAHKLLGQALEALGRKDAAVAQYKISLELEGRQNDLVLKVCELLADADVGIDISGARYWTERADKLFPHNPIVFQLKEKMISIDRPSNGSEDLESLIASELSARPNDIHLRVKLLKYYIGKNKFEDAYNHAVSVEATHSHRNSIVWYQVLSELLPKCKDTKQSDTSFWILYVSVLERYAALCLKEQGVEMLKTVPEAAQAVFNLDQSLTEFNLKNFQNNPVFIEHLMSHMWGQLNFHMACLFLRKTKREQGSWNEAGRVCAPLLLSALHAHSIDTTAPWVTKLKDGLKDLIRVWYREGTYRCSQAGHVLHDYARQDVKKLMDKVDQFCTGSWRTRVYQRIFVSRNHQRLMGTSYFCSNESSSVTLRLCSHAELKRYDEISEEVWPDSLHHQIWLGIKSRPHNKDNGPYPNQHSHVFKELQFSVYNINQAAPDSLCRLDIDAFLNAAILCSSVYTDEQQLSGYLNPERLPTLPADLTSTLCTSTQEKWWLCAYKMYSKQELVEGNLGEIRQELQRGLEVVRCIGNHGLHPAVLVHLARIFQHRVKLLKDKDKAHSDIPALEARCELYWTNAVLLLERLQNNQNIRMTSSKLFNYQGNDMSNVEITNALEEGKLLLTQRFLRDKQYEQAIDALQALKCPEASFQQGQIYKTLADEIVSSQPRESLTSETRSQHIIMLSKARNCFYLTLDRIRSPGIDPKHPLNSELCIHISDIENELKRIDPDLGRNDLHRNECDGVSDESYSSAHSGAEQPITMTHLNSSMNMLSTPQRNSHRTPKQSSTPCRLQHIDVLDLSRNRSEARPSPERLDAQIRQMMHSRDNIMQTIMEQNKAMMETNKTLMEKIDQLTKEMAELRRETQKQRTQPISASHPAVEEEPTYPIGEEECADLAYGTSQSAARAVPIPPISGNIPFAPSARNPYAPLVYPPTAFQGYYQGAIPFTDPNAQALPPLFPYSLPLYYSDRAKMPENMLQQGLFAPKMPNQLPDLSQPPPTQPLQMMPPKLDTVRTETIIKDAPVNKTPPVNVVITTSDTLPTTVPQVQTTLSVTIPPQYRHGNRPIPSTMDNANVPHSYQISMPSEATIPTTVNLPPLSATLTTTPAHISTMEMSTMSRSNVTAKESPNTSFEIVETEHDPIPDFVPVIPLPAEVKVTTGEEDETVLYCARAKLFRFVDKEWKERGVGDVKLLKNTEGKVRLLMRRDQVLKICANHLLRPDMELSAMPNNNRAWVWVANDFADETVKLEKLCIRFKTADEARLFKENFDKARLALPSSPESSFEIIEKSDVSPESTKTVDSSDVPVTPKSSLQKQVTEVSTPDSISFGKPKTTTTPVVVGGFSFTSKPIIQKDPTEVPKATQKTEEPPKVSPFAGFSFSKLADSGVTITPVGNTNVTGTTTAVSQPSTFSFVKSTPTMSPISFKSTAQPDQTNIFNPPTSADAITTLRRPHTITTSTSSPAETILFEAKASLQRCSKDSKQWKDKGTGQLKLTQDPKSEKVNLIIHKQDSSKNVCSHNITPDVKFTFKTGSDTTITYTIQDPAKENKGEYFAVTFDTSEQASHFYNTIFNIQQKLVKSRATVDCIKNIPSSTSIELTSQKAASEKTQKPLSEMFKPPAGSWECKACYTRNDSAKTTCAACNGPSPSAPSTGQVPLAQLFKTPAGSWECKDCYTRNDASVATCVACNGPNPSAGSTKPTETAPANQVPLSQMFKSASGSWECKGCYVVNASSNDYCVACDAPKDPSMPPKPKTNSFNLGPATTGAAATFSFGIPKTTGKEQGSGFNFWTPKTDDKAGGDAISSTTPTIFGTPAKSNEAVTGFVFGFPQQPSTPPSNKETTFTFGSPGKSFDFQLKSKSVIKSPGVGENSEEEVPESEDVYFPPVIPLPDKIDVKTGEENEDVLYSHRAKLFRFDPSTKEWKERGLGDIKLLKHKETCKLRLIMRRDQVLKLCLNHCVQQDLEFTRKDEKTLMWTAADYSEGEIEYMQFACRFKTSEIAEDFRKAVENAIKGEKTGTPSHEKKLSSVTKQSSQDIQVVYELKVTPEEKAAALKLQLPENFYAYKQKEDCPGCLGCREPSPELFEKKDMQKPIFSAQSTTLTGNKNITSTSQMASTLKPAELTSADSTTNAAKGFGFQLKPKTVINSAAEGENSEDEVAESEDVYFAPVIPLPEKVEIKTGEEDENVLYKQRAKLFKYDPNNKEWKERGIGEIKLLKHKQTGKLRLLMRREQVLKLCLNHAVANDLELTQKDEKTLMWTAADYSEGEIEYMQFACRFKTSEIAEAFKKAVENAIANDNTSDCYSASEQSSPEDAHQSKNVAKSSELSNADTSSNSTKLSSTTSDSGNIFSTSTTTSSVFGGFTPSKTSTTSKSGLLATPTIFGGTTFGEKKATTGFVFGGFANQTNAPPATAVDLSTKPATSVNQTGVLDSLKICSPFGTTNLPQQAGQTTPGVLDEKQSTINAVPRSPKLLFGTPQNATETTTTTSADNSAINTTPKFSNIFSAASKFPNVFNSASKNIFSANATTTPSTVNPTDKTNVPELGSLSSVPVFGSGPQLNSDVTPSFGSLSIGALAKSTDETVNTTNTAAAEFPPKFDFFNNSSVFGNAAVTSNRSIFGGKSGDDAPKDEESVKFLPTSKFTTFSTLASKAEQQEAFKKDPNFCFAGAGSCVFGSVGAQRNAIAAANKAKSNSVKKDENEQDDEENDDGQEHDPYFEPIVPLPEEIEVRTGEEEEEKVFGQRAKLYRFDDEVKEWKERGVGEMKLLYHAGRGSYRLLLRRDQVHKVVCNFLLTPDIEFQPPKASDRSWMWAGMNYIETAEIERLAVKFKSIEIALQFKDAVDKAQSVLRERQTSQGGKYVDNISDDEDKLDDDPEGEYEEEEEDDETSLTTGKRVTLYTKRHKDSKWKLVAVGNLEIYNDPDFFDQKLILRADQTGEIVSKTPADYIQTLKQVQGKEWIWTTIDFSLKPPALRTLKAVFSSPQAVQQMYTIYEKALENQGKRP